MITRLIPVDNELHMQWAMRFNISLLIIVYGPVAPMVERGPEEPSVGGSNPPRSAKIRTCSVVRFCESTARQIEALEASVRFRSGPQYCVVAQWFFRA